MPQQLREPSTYAGISAGVMFIPELIANPRNPQAWLGIVGALLAVLLPERPAAR